MTSAYELIPSASRLIGSLRDLGYDFSSAVADLIDNSLAADSTHVTILVQFDGDDSFVQIEDDGNGMTPQGLREALRYGADRDYAVDDLGKFGLGMKTASMSQCRRLTVASRSSRKRADITAYCWDLEHIQETNRWEILPVGREDLDELQSSPLTTGRGTVVRWEKLDRILGFKYPYGEAARKRLALMCRDLEQHLTMVFHRFLSGNARRKRKLRITLNDNRLLPWDPFCRSEKGTVALEPRTFRIETDGFVGDVLVEPYILPSQEDFSSPEAHRAAGGPSGWNQQQGFYVYRSDRLIQSGGWSRLRRPDEHTKLARIGVSFLPALDEAFKINVAKMRVQLPSVIRDAMQGFVAPIAKQARAVYDRKAPVVVGALKPARSAAVREGTGDHPEGSGFSRLSERRLLKKIRKSARQVATEREWPIVARVLTKVEEELTREGDGAARTN